MSTTKQTWDPNRYARNARFVSDLGMPVVELLAPQPGERILDLGCGDGALTEKIAALGCTVVGVDGSPEQVQAARQRGLEVYVRDGQQLAFDQMRAQVAWRCCQGLPHQMFGALDIGGA